MARKALGPAALTVAQAVRDAWPGDCVVGCSGGADSLALALGAHWVAQQRGDNATALIVDHGLQRSSADVAAHVAALLSARGMAAEVRRVSVDQSRGGLEAAAREARRTALVGPGLPVLLGHTLDDQAETVLLGLMRGSGTRSLAGMAGAAGQMLRPLLGLRRADTEDACRDWGVEPWADPMNDDPRFARVAIRQHLKGLAEAVGRDLAPALARTALLARADADFLDELAGAALDLDADLPVETLAGLPEALRWRVLHRWLRFASPTVELRHVLAVDALVTAWRGQGPIAVPGGRVARSKGRLTLLDAWT